MNPHLIDALTSPVLAAAEALLAKLPPEVQIVLMSDVRYGGYAVYLWEVIVLLILVVIFIGYVRFAFRPKYYFFVRHGQTVNNAKHVRQGSEGGLTESGIHQAERTGAFLKGMHLQKIYASPFERTRQTAEVLNKFLNLRIVFSELLVERRNPAEVIGKSMEDPNIRRISETIDLTFHDDDYRFSDEENFMDLKKRAKKALRYLRRRHQHRICVVTHGYFLKMLISCMLYPRDLHAKDWVKLSFFSPADNGGITIVRYSPLKRLSANRGWDVLSYNVTMPTEGGSAMGYGLANLSDLIKEQS
jgi:probable phosphoglycerate mutase